MDNDLLFALSAVAALVPAAIFGVRPDGRPDATFWAVLAVAIAGPAAWAAAQTSGAWQTGFSTALWVTIAASMAIFGLLCIMTRDAWRLTPLIAPYMVIVAVLATVWQQQGGQPLSKGMPVGWVSVHIAVSVLTYALVTIAAVAALAAAIQERALRAKQPTTWTHRLPSVADSERLQVRLLILGEIVLAVGLATGVATQYEGTGALMTFDHKTILTVTTFLVIGSLLVAQYYSGVRGRLMTRLVLLAYLLLTLGYPGVKFVTDVVMA